MMSLIYGSSIQKLLKSVIGFQFLLQKDDTTLIKINLEFNSQISKN